MHELNKCTGKAAKKFGQIISNSFLPTASFLDKTIMSLKSRMCYVHSYGIFQPMTLQNATVFIWFIRSQSCSYFTFSWKFHCDRYFQKSTIFFQIQATIPTPETIEFWQNCPKNEKIKTQLILKLIISRIRKNV